MLTHLRVVVAAIAVLTSVALAPSHAESARVREVNAGYWGAGGSSSNESLHFSTSSNGSSGYGGAWFDAGEKETSVKVRVEDITGWPIAAHVNYEGRDHQRRDLVICGMTSGAIQIAPGTSVGVFPVVGTCPNGTRSTPVSGTISATFVTPAPPPRRSSVATPPGVVPPSDRWALLVGVQNYRSPTKPTIGSAKDVSVIKRALLRAGWPESHIRVLVNDAATGSAVREGMRWLAEVSSPRSFSIFHYSGHVKQTGGHEYLWPIDRGFISDTDTVNLLRRVEGRAWFDFAGCEGGGFDDGLASDRHLVTASSQSWEKSYENPEWGLSVWTALLFEFGMWRGEADANRNHQVTIGEALDYANVHAPDVTKNEQPYGPQNPYRAGGWGTDWRLEAPPL